MRSGSLSQNGFSLIELMIGVAVMSIVLLAGVTLLNTENLLFGNLELQTSRDSLRGVLIRTFTNPTMCLDALSNAGNLTLATPANLAKAGINPPPGPPPAGMPLNITLDRGSTKIISHDPATVPAPSPTNLPRYNIAYEYVALRNAIVIGPDPNTPNGTNTLYEGSVVMKTDKPTNSKNIIGGSAMALLTVGNLFFSVDNTSNHITSCYTNYTVNSACSNLNGTGSAGAANCTIKSPCPTGQLFLGDGPVTGQPLCKPLCAAGKTYAYNAAGVLVCQTP